jgi:putative tricarboxylic transport membrane protein
VFAATALADAALKFGPPEFLAIGAIGLIFLVRLSGGSLLKNVIMLLIGLALSTVGTDRLHGTGRFTLGLDELGQGVEFLPVAMGLFGIAEVMLATIENESTEGLIKVRMRDLLPRVAEWKRSVGPIFRGSFIGFFIGLLPGPSPVISTFVSYISEKKLSKHPEEFGEGAIEGVAGPEAANNAAVGGAYVPLLALGVPFTPAMAVVVGALMLHGITPGPMLMVERPELFWGVIASMYIGNVMLLVLNLPLVQVFAKIVEIPKKILLPLVTLMCLIGVYSVNSSYLDLYLLAFFGVVGFVLRGLGYQPAPLVLALVIGPMMETAMRESLMINQGALAPLFLRPIAGTLYAAAAIALLLPPLLRLRKRGSAAAGPAGAR